MSETNNKGKMIDQTKLEKCIKSLQQNNECAANAIKTLVECTDDNAPALADVRWLFQNASMKDIKERLQKNAGIKK